MLVFNYSLSKYISYDNYWAKEARKKIFNYIGRCKLNGKPFCLTPSEICVICFFNI